MEAATLEDGAAAELAFDQALRGHAEYFLGNFCRAVIYGLSGSHAAPAPAVDRIAPYYRRLAQMSAAFAVTADLVLMILGGSFKRKEMMSGRFADAFSYMFYTSAVLKQFESAGQPRSDLPLVEWSAKYSLYQVQMALDEILRNFPIKWLGLLLRPLIFPLGLSLRPPNDMLCHRVASLLIRPGEARDRLTAGIYLNDDPEDITGRLEDALVKVIAAEPLERRLRHEELEPSGLEDYPQWVSGLRESGEISADEAELLLQARTATTRVIMVDDFRPQQLTSGGQPTKNKAASKRAGGGKATDKKKSARTRRTTTKSKSAIKKKKSAETGDTAV
jgi:acyl-CoA dehydrogenase